ncbi:sulfotransferase family 2 domain-containing protein [Burkholderia cepacia]|uniref:Sulfotransferase domain-containing protein n=2 Tax=Burkholderiaceae TaxID=119060 RepID=A0A365QMS9_9BURK|nr:sulfotransferase family 2 domain-containing protein [Burkholderia cepacia]RBB35362.1 hypothetical protein DPV79_28595 [Burkholderia reimsis]RQT85286.1 hypothetical protein DF023_11885 [Burkholderia cepacia]RQU04384.1 hypothetical protein DF022_14290 [Burkholderia cepacia]RQZ81190.1 hypothetical protein DF056_12420 [Burkholderia cepacia]RRA05654.1 hypothetical protein DF055_11250 [Burkholderia cepacia]
MCEPGFMPESSWGNEDQYKENMKISRRESNNQADRLTLYTLLSNSFVGEAVGKEAWVAHTHGNTELCKFLEGLDRRNLYRIIFDRPPERVWGIGSATELNRKADLGLLHDLVFSEENKVIGEIVFAKTIENKGMDIFIHIPKTAGTTVNNLLDANSTLLRNACFDISTLVALYRDHTQSRRIVFSGHRTLEFYDRTINLSDVGVIFTSIRDPIDVAISYFNFAFTMVRNNDEAWGAQWRPFVDEWQSSGAGPSDWFVNYCGSEFFRRNVSNIYFDYLGEPSNSPDDARAIIDNMLRFGVFAVKSDRVNDFIADSEGGERLEKNKSDAVVTRDTLGFDILLHLRRLMPTNVEFYALLDHFSTWRKSGYVDFRAV